jgi:hypothetical protein
MAYSRGKYSHFISDRSGMRFPYKERAKEWNGSVVHISEYEAKHPQLETRQHIPDPEALREPRTDRTEPAVGVWLSLNPFKTSSSGSGTITVTEKSHGRSASDTIRFRDVEPFDGLTSTVMEIASGYSIVSVVDDDSYTVTVSGTATTGSVKGGGKIASAGPVTLES